jgi:signal transduction histidine kinase
MAAAVSIMTGNPYLTWAIQAVSLFNAILLAWLGLTVLLNSDRRRWGIWVAGGGMLLGAAFFISHSALFGLGFIDLDWNALVFWWSIGLLSAVTLPFLWYVIMLWYGGYWEDRSSPLHKRHRAWLALTALLLLLGIAGIISAAVSLGIDSPRFGRWFLTLRFSEWSIPLLVFGFSAYMLLCIALSIDALRNPGPSARVMGRLARRRARPWLVGAALGLLFVAVIVTAVLFWVAQQSQEFWLYQVYENLGPALALLDLLVLLLIAAVIVLLGQAIVSYEVFTGKSLPRRGLSRQWQRALFLAAGGSALVATALTLPVEPIYGFLSAVLLMTLFYALVSWRSYEERERLMDSLRPFVSSQGLYDSLITPVKSGPANPAGNNPAGVDLASPFYALCHDVLETERAYLTAAGPFAALIDKPLIYPPGEMPALSSLQPIVESFDAAQLEPIALDPALYSGASWAIPLWSGRGLTGVLLLGQKLGRGLYTKEEVEIAAISGERLIDTQAGIEMSRRLLDLQRRHMAQTQVVDQQTRRVLHDEILPDLHAAMIRLSAVQGDKAGDGEDLLALLAGTHRQISDLLRELPAAAPPEVERLGLIPALRRTVEQEYAAAFDALNWRLEEEVGQKVDALSAGVIYYAAREAVRNAARHGRDPDSRSPFTLTVTVRRPAEADRILPADDGELQILIEDNGQGLAGQSFSGANGGQGLLLHSTMMAIIGGTLAVTSAPGAYTRVTLAFPNSAMLKN